MDKIALATTKPGSQVSRAQIRKFEGRISRVIKQIGASNGRDLASDIPKNMVPIDIIKGEEKLECYRQWIESPVEPGPDTTSRRHAISLIEDCKEAKVTFISHICEIPQHGSIPDFKWQEAEAGVFAMVYGIILQLLQFGSRDDMVHVDQTTIGELGILDGEDSWKAALWTMEELITSTYAVRYCIIHGLNDLEGAASEMCDDFLDSLRICGGCRPLLRVFTTSGKSSLLDKYVHEHGITKNTTTLQDLANIDV